MRLLSPLKHLFQLTQTLLNLEILGIKDPQTLRLINQIQITNPCDIKVFHLSGANQILSYLIHV